MVASLILWIGLATIALGALGIVRPIRTIGLPTRGRGVILLFVGWLLVVVACELPTPTMTVPGPDTRLDAIAPSYQLNETHAIEIDAPAERVYAAMREVTAREIPLFQTLTWIRRFGRTTGESILNAPDSVPIIDVATTAIWPGSAIGATKNRPCASTTA